MIQEAWRDDAACRDMHYTIFFPDRGSPGTYPKMICNTCPVIRECLAFAFLTNVRHGIFGGMTVRERDRFRKKHRVRAHVA